ncbi:hypothetical protein [Lichenicoccus roseus]|uniref:Uncharacterized protein n=1 Tax=Lichenicoccus roseus TaxID=2683649 RepID=A0A5R9JC92_9PROT|nr:hypothetical protein [Lichenicoccus roseus]TLU71908.1 hypothetical protein FE263_15815 [Lichenicoccus roseus]
MNQYRIYKLEKSHQILRRREGKREDSEHAFSITCVFIINRWLAEVWVATSKLDVPMLALEHETLTPKADLFPTHAGSSSSPSIT